MADLENRHCGNCAWALNVGDDEICVRAEINVPLKGLTAVIDGIVCKWNAVDSIGIDHYLQKLYKSDAYILATELQQEAAVGPIDQLHL